MLRKEGQDERGFLGVQIVVMQCSEPSLKLSHDFSGFSPAETSSTTLTHEVSGARIAIPLIGILLLSLGGCATTQPVARTSGNTSRLMTMPEYEQVRSSNEDIKRWAREALHTVNDLEFEVRRGR